jgi:hypothetical protein
MGRGRKSVTMEDTLEKQFADQIGVSSMVDMCDRRFNRNKSRRSQA